MAIPAQECGLLVADFGKLFAKWASSHWNWNRDSA
jgi:hypothetical protein